MKEVVLKKIKPSERLIQLIDKIEFLEIVGDGYVQQKLKGGNKYTIYNYITNNINWLLNLKYRCLDSNKLLNKYKLSDAIHKGITCISQDQFCDILEEHLYLVGKNKLMELLPEIEKRVIHVDITDDDEIRHFEPSICGGKTIVYIGEYGELNHNSDHAYDYIWEDRDEFILEQDINPYPDIKRGYMLSTKRGPDDYKRYIVIDWSEDIVLEYEDLGNILPRKFNYYKDEIITISNNKGDIIWTKKGEDKW